MEFCVLGPFEIADDGRPVEVRAAKPRILLAALVCRAGTPVPVDSLVEALWGSDPPASARQNVRLYVHQLRRAVGDGRIAHQPAGYVLSVAPGEVDAIRFEALADQGHAALVADDVERAARLLREGLALWRGRAYADVDGAPLLRAEADRLAERRQVALEARIEADLACGEHQSLVAELSGLVRDHPLRERLHGLLMLALYRSGRQAEALAAYRQARQLLADELGIDPGPALQQLEAAILAHDPHLDWAQPGGEPSGPPPGVTAAGRRPGGARTAEGPVVWNAPARNPHFVGRTELLDELHQRLSGGGSTVVVQTLHGLGGGGKTQLAIEYAHRFADAYQQVWWIDAEQPALLTTQMAALACPLGLPSDLPADETVQLVLAELRRLPAWLLIFDNAQRPQELAGCLPAGAGHVLVTSRHPGWGALGGRLEVDVLARADTVALLRRRLPDIDEGLADQLADQLGDLPLAAAQAAGYLESTGLPPDAYLRRFRTRQASLLPHGEVVGYQGRLDTAWALSMARLAQDSPAAVALLQLAAFCAPEPIPLRLFSDHSEQLDEPLRSTLADPDQLDDIVGLTVGYSLLRRQADHIQLHRMVQAAIRHQLTPAQQRATVARVLALLAAAHPGDPDDPANWIGYAQLAPHVLATSAPGEDHPAHRQLVLDTSRYLHSAGSVQASRTVSGDLLDRWRQRLGPDHPTTLGMATTLALALAWSGEAEAARGLGRDTLDRCQQAFGPDHPTTLHAAAALAISLAWLGELDAARALGRRLQALGADHPTTLRAAAALALALAWQGDLETACALGHDTVEHCRRVFGPDHPTTLRTAAALAYVLAWSRQAPEARALGCDTLDRCRQSLGPNHPTTLGTAAVLITALAWSGEAQPARALGRDTLDRCRHTLGPDHATTFSAATALTLALARLREAQPARALGRDTLDRCQQVLGPNHPTTLLAAAVLITVLAWSGETEAAHALGRDTVERCRQAFGRDHPTTFSAATALTLALAWLGETEAARELGRYTLNRCQQALGPDHPTTRRAETALTTALDKLT